MKRNTSNLVFFPHRETESTLAPVRERSTGSRYYYPAWTQEAITACIQQCQHRAVDQNYSLSISEGFIWFHLNTEEDELLRASRGVKFHVSLSHDPLHYCQGINIVIGVLFELKMAEFKIAHPSYLSTPKYTEAGREITIYTFMLREPPITNERFNARLSQLIQAINQQLTAASILPYQNAQLERTIPTKDSEIPGCPFTTWRDDRTVYGCDVPKIYGIGLYQPQATSTKEDVPQLTRASNDLNLRS